MAGNDFSVMRIRAMLSEGSRKIGDHPTRSHNDRSDADGDPVA